MARRKFWQILDLWFSWTGNVDQRQFSPDMIHGHYQVGIVDLFKIQDVKIVSAVHKKMHYGRAGIARNFSK